jgi:hypothetical protein
MKPGDKVQTNDAYFNLLGRRVYGEVESVVAEGHCTIVRWDKQIGNQIPDHQGQRVLMMTRDLEPDKRTAV